MTICVAGKNNIAVSVLEFLLKNHPEHDFIVVCAKNDDGINSWQRSLKHLAITRNIPIKTLEEVYPLQDLLFLSLQFDRIIKPELFATKRLYNIHFSLLPAYKGMYPSMMPLLNDEERVGVTLHEIDAGIDTGAIVDQLAFPVEEQDNAKSTYDKLVLAGIEIFRKNVDSLINQTAISRQQDYRKASYYSKSALDLGNQQIDLRKTAVEIHNQIRAFSFRDYQLPKIGEYKIYRSEVVWEPSDKKRVASFVKVSEDKLLIQGVDYQVYAYIDFEEELFDAAKKGDIDYIDHLYKLGFDITIRNKSGWNILIVATYNEHKELVQYLIHKEFDIDTANYKGTSVLMYTMTAASKSGRTDILDLIVSGKVDFKHKDDRGLDVLDYARKYGDPVIIKYIQSHYDKIS